MKAYVSNDSSVASRKGSKIATAALLTKPWIGIFKFSKVFLAVLQSDKSTVTGTIFGTSAARESKYFFVRDTAMTLAPHSANFLAIPLPIPEF